MAKAYLPAVTEPALDALYQDVPTDLFFETPEGAALAFAHANQNATPEEQLTATQIAARVNGLRPDAEHRMTPMQVGKIVHNPKEVLEGIRDRWAELQQQESAVAQQQSDTRNQSDAAQAAQATDAKSTIFNRRNPFLAKAMLGAMELAAHIKGDRQAEEQAHQANVAVTGDAAYQNPAVRAYDAPGRFMQRLLSQSVATYQRAMAIDQAGKQRLHDFRQTAQAVGQALADRAAEDTRMLQSLLYSRETAQEGSTDLSDADAQRADMIALLHQAAIRE